MSKNMVICWREKLPGSLPPDAIFDSLVKNLHCDGLEELAVEEVAREILDCFSKKGKNVERLGNSIRWNSGWYTHAVEVRKFYFGYHQSLNDCSAPSAFGGNLEICDFPSLAGLFGCSMYFPGSGTILRRPLGAFVRSPRVLTDCCSPPPKHPVVYQLPIVNLVPPMQTALFTIKKCPEELEAANGIIFEDDIDSLSEYRLALMQVESCEYFLIKRPRADLNIEVYVHDIRDCSEEAVNQLMLVLGLTRREIPWIRESIDFTEYELWRQDDNGNRAMMELCSCLADALRQVKLYTDRGHKQMYWTKPRLSQEPSS